MENAKKIGFFKRIKMSLLELENYIQFTAEKNAKAFGFAIKMTILFALVIAVSSAIYIHVKYQSITNYVDSIVPDFSYNEHNLTINEEDKKDENKKMVISLMQELEPTYREILPDGSNSKVDLLNFIRQNEKQILIFFYSTLIFETILEMFLLWMFIGLLTSLIGLIVLRFCRIKMKYSKLYVLAIYASTLSMILTVLYTILNNYFNIYINIFEYLSMLIAYIYITAVIYMIRSDLVKQQLELMKIATVQAKVREQLDKEDEEERKKEKDKKEEKPEQKDEKKEGKIDTNDEPDGSEI